MVIVREYRDDGALFSMLYRGKTVRFPLDESDKKITRDEDWTAITALEQLDAQGLLQISEEGYLLTPDNFFIADRELLELLPLPQHPAALEVCENGNVADKGYSVSWYARIHGKNAGKTVRRGFVASAGGSDFYLSREQYDMISYLETFENRPTTEDRARFHAKATLLAKRSGTAMSSFMEKREFCFSDSAEPEPVSISDHEVEIVPRLGNVPEGVLKERPKRIRGTFTA